MEKDNTSNSNKNSQRSTVAQYRKSKLGAETPFNILEAYKTARTNLLFALAATNSNITIVSSALPNEGKSVTCSNMAIAMSQTGSRVLLIDADLRKPVQHKIFRVDNNKGLSRLLVGFDSLEDTIKKNVERNLDLITTGPLPPIPSELLGSQKMEELLAEMSKVYDYIFIDTPPVNVVTDTLVVSRHGSSGILLVARQKQTTHEDLQKAIKSIKFAQTNILGILLSDVEEKQKRKGKYRYYSGYNYSYSNTSTSKGTEGTD